MATFDLDAARKAGHSDEEIAGFLSEQLNFDLAGAQQAGYPTNEILDSLLVRVNAPVASAAPPAPAAPAESPRENGSFLPIVKDFLKETGIKILEERLKPLAAMSPTAGPTGLAQYVTSNGLADALDAAPPGSDPGEVVKGVLQNNVKDVLLSSFDVGTLAVAAPAHAALRGLAATAGLRPALQTVLAAAGEGAGYLGTYNGLEAVLEGHSAAETAKGIAEGVALGGTIGAGTGALGAVAAHLINRQSMSRALRESASTRQFFEDAQATLKEMHPHLTPQQVDANAKRIVFEGVPIEELKLPTPPAPSKVSGGWDDEITRLFPDEQSTLAFDKAVGDLSRPAVSPVLIEERARRVPYFGLKELRPFVRAEAAGPPSTLRDHYTDIRNGFAGLFTAEPGATNEVKNLFYQARATLSSATDRANQTIYQYIFRPLGTGKDVGEKTAQLSDYLVHMDRLATMRSKAIATGGMEETFIPGIGKVNIIGSGGTIQYPSGPGGTSIAQWEQSFNQVAEQVRKHPDILQAAKATRWLLDEMHQTMVEYGLIAPERFREDYLPAQRLYEIASGLAQDMSGTAVGRELSATLKRNAAGEIVQTNLVRVLQKSLTALNRKVAEIELWRAIETNPRLNLTDQFAPGDIIPKGFKKYAPGPGMPGYRGDDAIEEALAGAIDGLQVPEARFTQGTFILPEDLANRLQHFYERSGSPVERQIYNASNMLARQFTIYNLSNTSLNMGSDFFLAMLGLPGEKSNMLGFLRFLPSSIKAAYRGAFGKESSLYARASREGIAGGTFIRSVGGEPVSKELAPAILQGHEPGVATKLHDFYDNLIRLRQAVEATPRIAAGRAAETAIGDPAEFARVGREITLPYGAGDPRISRVPVMRLLAPFWRFQGMATERILRLATTKGSRARGIAALATPAVGAALWNLQNENYRKVEYSLGQYDRNHLHVIIPDPIDPSKPFRKANGQPMVFRARFWAPEEVAGMYGLGNLPGRLIDVGAGYTSPEDAIKEVGSEVGENIASMAAPLTTAQQLLTGRSNLTGQQQELFERTETTLPAFYHFGKFFETAHNEGLLPAVGQAPLRIMGIRPAGARLGRADAKVLQLRRELRDAQMHLRVAGAKGDKFRMEFYRKKIDRLAKRLHETQAGRQRIEGQDNGISQP